MKIEKLSTNRVKFSFTVTKDEFEHGLDHAFEHIKNEVEVKGFRKGHVTRSVYEARFGVESLFEDALNHVLQHKYSDAINQKEYEIVGDPKVDIDFNLVQRGVDFPIAFEVAVKPEVELGQYKGIEVSKKDDVVSEDLVDAEIKSLLDQNAVLEPKTEGVLEKGDTAVFDFEGFTDGVAFEGGKAENYSLEIGSGQFIPGFEDGMLGLKVGEERDVNVTFPEQYHSDELAGKPAVFKVKLHEIKTKVGAELTDEWVKTLNREGVETVDALKTSIRETLEQQRKSDNKNLTLDEALKVITANAQVDIPQEMIDYEIKQAKENIKRQAKQYGIEYDMYISLSGLDKETFETQLGEDAKLRILNTLVIEAIAKKENITAPAEDVAKKYEELASQYQMPVEEIKKYIRPEMVEQDVTFTKAVDFIFENTVQK
ncbi:MAG TPA: trigger factor [Acholeplasma sp.]|jgi:trigger factor|nr:trigger factor [Acholeplasma sp.]